MPRLRDPELITAEVKDLKRGSHGDEYPEEEDRDLQDRMEIKTVGLMIGFWCDLQRDKGGGDHENLAERRRKKYREEDGQKADQVPEPFELDRNMRAGSGLLMVGFVPGRVKVDGVKNSEQDDKGHAPEGNELERPKKRNSQKVSEKKRRVAERRQESADIAHDHDKKNGNVNVVFAVMIREKERTDQDHAGARGSDQVGKQGAEGKHSGIHDRHAAEVASEPDPSRNNEERAEQDHERKIVFEARQEKTGIMIET